MSIQQLLLGLLDSALSTAGSILGSFYGQTSAKYVDISLSGLDSPVSVSGSRITLPSNPTGGVARVIRLKDAITNTDLPSPTIGFIDIHVHRDSADGNQTLGVLIGVTDWNPSTFTAWQAAMNGTGYNYLFHARRSYGSYGSEAVSGTSAGADTWIRIGVIGDKILASYAANQADLDIIVPTYKFTVSPTGSALGAIGLSMSNAGEANKSPYIENIKIINVTDPEMVNLQFEGADGSQTFTDAHGNVWTPDDASGALISTSSPLKGTSSAVFGPGHFISTPWPYLFDLSGPFTFECDWEPPSDFASKVARFVCAGTPVYGDNYLAWYCDHGSFRMYTGTYGYSDSWQAFNDLVPTTGVKVSLALTRDASNVLRMFMNGVASSNQSTIFVDWSHIGRQLLIGSFPGEGSTVHTGKVDNIRLSLACKYTANYATEYSYWDHVVLALHGDTDPSAGIVDSKGNYTSPTSYRGTSAISTDQSKFGGASIRFNADGGLIYVTSHTDPNFQFGTGTDFSIVMWIRIDSSAHMGTNRAIFDSRHDAGTALGFVFFVNPSNVLCMYSGTSYILPAGPTLPTDQWVHVAVTRQGSTLRIFQDGAIILTNGSGTFDWTDGRCCIGDVNPEYQSTTSWFGWMDDIQIVKGLALYTDTFTPPTAPFPNS